MNTTDHEGRARLQLASSTVGDVDGADDQDQVVVVPGAELVPAEQADELETRSVTPVPVTLEGPVLSPAQRPAPANRPVLPLWLRDVDTFRAAAVWAGRRSGHLAAFHCVRLPLYWLRLVGRSPVGVGRAVAHW